MLDAPNWSATFGRVCSVPSHTASTLAKPSTKCVFTRNRVEIALDGAVHPTQKPVDLMRWCIVQADQRSGKRMALVLDPFMGSGTTLRAAKDLGRRAIGIEIEERYCEIAAERLSQGVLDFGSPRRSP